MGNASIGPLAFQSRPDRRRAANSCSCLLEMMGGSMVGRTLSFPVRHRMQVDRCLLSSTSSECDRVCVCVCLCARATGD
eukprot:15444807-Alexandrium_andersonii.AAC.2